MPKGLETIAQNQKRNLSDLKRQKNQVSTFDIYRYPTPTKRIKSLSLLRRKIEEFFEAYDVSDKTKARRLPLPNDLALYLGYSSYSAMARDINSPVDQRYSAELERAVERINTNLMRMQLDISQKTGDQRGVDSVLNRIERTNNATKPEEMDRKSQISIQINIENAKRIEDTVAGRLDALMKSSRPNVANVDDAVFAEKIETGEEE